MHLLVLICCDGRGAVVSKWMGARWQQLPMLHHLYTCWGSAAASGRHVFSGPGLRSLPSATHSFEEAKMCVVCTKLSTYWRRPPCVHYLSRRPFVAGLCVSQGRSKEWALRPFMPLLYATPAEVDGKDAIKRFRKHLVQIQEWHLKMMPRKPVSLQHF